MSDIRHGLHLEIKAAAALRENLKDIIGDDDEAMRDTLEGETGLHELIDAAIADISKDVANIEGLSAHITKLSERKQRLKTRIDHVRVSILSAMEVAELKTKETPLATVSRRNVAPKLIVSDEAMIPSDYWKPQPPALDKKLLSDRLKAKEQVPGAELSNGGETLSIRWS